MNKDDLFDYIRKLDWNLPPEEQKRAIDEIKSLDEFDYSLLLQPLGKQYWENSAVILCSLDKELLDKQIICGLFNWLQDLNWPGANIIFAHIKSLINHQVICDIWKMKLQQAYDDQDNDWLTNLKMLS